MGTQTQSTPNLLFKRLAAFDKKDAELISIRNNLYDCSWDDMLKDLNANMINKAYILKLSNRMRVDISRIKAMLDLSEEELGDIIVEFGGSY